MRFSATSRRLLPLALVALLICGGAPLALGQQRNFAFARRDGAGGRQAARPAAPPARPAQGQQRGQPHLQQWMQQHSNLSLADQQRALQNEPGFRDYPAETQQRLHDRLAQLNNMPPARRQRMLEQTEAMERLTMPQRQQVRGAMAQLGALPEDRRRLVARAFRDLREMPAPQRQSILNSDRFRGQFSPQERSTLSNLLTVEPYLPAEHPNEAPVPGR